MAEYIERDKVYQDVGMLVIDNDDLTRYEDGRNMGVFNAMSVIENAPAADVRPERHGHWIYQEPDDEFSWKPYLCSACREKGGKNYTEFCPHCGAKMDEESEGDQNNG